MCHPKHSGAAAATLLFQTGACFVMLLARAHVRMDPQEGFKAGGVARLRRRIYTTAFSFKEQHLDIISSSSISIPFSTLRQDRFTSNI
jgi:hypothetical protein